ncbi:hypothetical protein OH76DRAFT_976114 [Lentinus brumalis]|uniref:Uncharacterized protein n=1 Tax=Lentinus brumalis TaxID=2498619 RepID=A0A371DPT6_9APHY|nr:hypothetical protein OH76DRAFT_976114 [Polyporus brumalis]
MRQCCPCAQSPSYRVPPRAHPRTPRYRSLASTPYHHRSRMRHVCIANNLQPIASPEGRGVRSPCTFSTYAIQAGIHSQRPKYSEVALLCRFTGPSRGLHRAIVLHLVSLLPFAVSLCRCVPGSGRLRTTSLKHSAWSVLSKRPQDALLVESLQSSFNSPCEPAVAVCLPSHIL